MKNILVFMICLLLVSCAGGVTDLPIEEPTEVKLVEVLFWAEQGVFLGFPAEWNALHVPEKDQLYVQSLDGKIKIFVHNQMYGMALTTVRETHREYIDEMYVSKIVSGWSVLCAPDSIIRTRKIEMIGRYDCEIECIDTAWAEYYFEIASDLQTRAVIMVIHGEQQALLDHHDELMSIINFFTGRREWPDYPPEGE